MTGAAALPAADDAARFAVLLRRIALPALAAVAMLGVYTSIELRPLFNDGFYHLFKMLLHDGFYTPNPARESAEMLMQAPTIAALRMGVRDLAALAIVFSLGVQLVPLALILGCWFVLPRGDKHFFVFPLLSLFAGTLSCGFGVIAAGSTATSYFWLLFFSILFRSSSARGLDIAVLLAMPVIVSSETMVFLAPLLIAAAIRRARAARSRVDLAICAGLVAWLIAVMAYHAYWIANPRIPENKAGFVQGLLEGWWLVGARGQINVPAAVGVGGLAAVALMSFVALARGTSAGRVGAWLAAAHILFSAAVLAWAIVDDRMMAIDSQFSARNLDAILSFPLGVAALVALWRPRTVDYAVLRHALRSCLVMGAVSVVWHVNATIEWSRYLKVAGRIAVAPPGFNEWAPAVARLAEADRRRDRTFTAVWILEPMSILLAPGGKVSAIAGRRHVAGWRAFDPFDPEKLPRSRFWDLTPYAATLPGRAPPPDKR